MANYSNLEIGGFYLVRENEAENIVLVEALMETNECVLIIHHDDYETTHWRKKTDELTEIVEQLTDEQVTAYNDLFDEEEDDDDDNFFQEGFEEPDYEEAVEKDGSL